MQRTFDRMMAVNPSKTLEYYEEAMERAQREVDREVAEGHHPFTMLAKLNTTTSSNALGDFPFMEAHLSTSFGRQAIYDEFQLKVLEQLEPYWDVCQNHFKGKFSFSARIHRDIRKGCFHIYINVHFHHVDDMDNFKVMTKLHGLSEYLVLDLNP